MFSAVFIFTILVTSSLQIEDPVQLYNYDADWNSRAGRESWTVLDSIRHILTNVKNAFSKFYQELSKNTKSPKEINFDEPKGRSNLILRYGATRNYFAKPEMSAEQMIVASGYRPQSHTVLTEDGYMLTIHRILPSMQPINKKKRVVLLHHGIFGSSDNWLLSGHRRALPYMLTESGYDVWLLNARGNRYSRTHTSKNVEMQEYWDFTFHEIAVCDLPAVIKYVAEITDKAEINYIGHSLGATALLALLSTTPEYNFILRSGILLAPLAFMYNAKGPIRMLADIYSKNGHHSIHFLGKTSFFPDDTFPNQITERYCKGPLSLCLNPLLLLCDGGKDIANERLREEVLKHVPDGGSAKTLIHYVQMVRSGYFQNFDYGAQDNYRKYGNATAPFYNLKRVTLPIAVFGAAEDWLSTPSDLKTLIPLLQYIHGQHIIQMQHFGHLDFLWSPIAPEVIYELIISTLEKILPHKDEFFEH